MLSAIATVPYLPRHSCQLSIILLVTVQNHHSYFSDHDMVALYTSCSDNTILVRMSILGYIAKFANPKLNYQLIYQTWKYYRFFIYFKALSSLIQIWPKS